MRHASIVLAIVISGFALCQLQPATTEFSRSAILEGEVWRLLTCHLVHMDWMHMLLNSAGFLLCLVLGRGVGSLWYFAATLAWLGLCVSLPTLLFHPELEYYRGFSGVLYGLVGLAIAYGLRDTPLLEYAVLGVLALKVLNDLIGVVPALRAEQMWSFDVFAFAHLYGLLGALLLYSSASLLSSRLRSAKK